MFECILDRNAVAGEIGSYTAISRPGGSRVPAGQGIARKRAYMRRKRAADGRRLVRIIRSTRFARGSEVVSR